MFRYLIATLTFAITLTACDNDDNKPERRSSKREPSGEDAKKPEPVTPNQPVDSTPQTTDPVSKGLGEVQQSNIEKDLRFLASAELAGRESGTPGNNQAAEYIAQQFQALGMQPGLQDSFFQAFNTQNGNTQNVIGVFPGNDPSLKNEVVVMGAHLDHLGQGMQGIYYGADDNASGSSAILAMAKAVAANKDAIKRTVVAIAFSGEEMGLLGSQYYVRNPVFPLNQTVLMINLDMVGYGRGSVEVEGMRPDSVGLRHMQNLQSKYSDLNMELVASSTDRSDNAPFANAGIPVTVFHTGLHGNYHQPTDTVEKIDFTTLTTIAKVAFELAYAAANDSQAGFDARQSQALLLSSFETSPLDFQNYFSVHGLGHQPEGGRYDHALLPGQPL